MQNNPVDGDVQALIKYCECEIEKFKRCVAEYPDAPVLRSDLKLHEIALAALTAPPAQLLRPVELPARATAETFGGLSLAKAYGWNACLAEVQRLNATAQPVSDGWVKCSERMPKFGTSVLVWDEGVITGESTGSTTSFGLGIFWVSDQKEDSGSVKCYATHWMPLPAAPGGQDD